MKASPRFLTHYFIFPWRPQRCNVESTTTRKLVDDAPFCLQLGQTHIACQRKAHRYWQYPYYKQLTTRQQTDADTSAHQGCVLPCRIMTNFQVSSTTHSRTPRRLEILQQCSNPSKRLHHSIHTDDSDPWYTKPLRMGPVPTAHASKPRIVKWYFFNGSGKIAFTCQRVGSKMPVGGWNC